MANTHSLIQPSCNRHTNIKSKQLFSEIIVATSIADGCCKESGIPTYPHYLVSEGVEQVTFWKYDIHENSWLETFSNVKLQRQGKVVILQGIIHYFLHANIADDSLGFYYDPQLNKFLPLDGPGLDTNATNYFIYPVESSLSVN